MIDHKRKWAAPVLKMLGDVASLTQQPGGGTEAPGPPCPPAVMKGHGTGDTQSNSQTQDPNPNNGCNFSGL